MPYVQVADDETSSDANAPVDNGKPFAKASVSVATNRLDWGQVAGKTAAREEDDGLVEEDPLPPYLNPAGIYTSLLHQKRKREHASAPFVSLPPRTIGGLQDQILPTITCACKSSKCIRLYCDCFASSLLCTGKCTCADGCHNDGASEHTHTRTGTILGILNAQSLAFRPSPEQLELASAGAINEYMSKQTAPSRSCSCRKSRCLKAYCECWNAGTYCQDDKCSCKSTCSNRPGIEEREVLMARRNGADTVAEVMDFRVVRPAKTKARASGIGVSIVRPSLKAISLPPSAFATPVQVDGKLVQGLSFGRALPVQQGQGTNGKEDSPSKRRLYHNLMLSPSKLGAVSKKKDKTKGTELEVEWNDDTGEVREFFRIMRRQINSRKNGDTDESSEDEATETRVRSVLEQVEEDIKNADKVVEAAELDILTRLKKKRKPSQYNLDSTEDDESADDVAELKCEETLMLSEEARPIDPALKELTVRAAQETALLREAARVIRRKARELCERRISSSRDSSASIGDQGNA